MTRSDGPGKVELWQALVLAHSESVLFQFFNSVRLWDFIEDRESRTVSSAEEDVTELGELFMHLSGAEEDPATSQ